MPSPDLAEYIGGESYSILKYDVEDEPPRAASVTKSRSRSRLEAALEAAEKEYPPVIRRRPSVLKKYTTSDGRLLMRQEKVESHVSLLAHRADGRLLLTMHVEDFEWPENMDGDDDDDDDDDDGVNAPVDPKVDKEEEEVGPRECYNILNESGVSSTCGGFAPITAFGPPLLI